MPLFPKNVGEIFGFLQTRWNMKGGTKDLVIKWSFSMQQVSLYLNTKNVRKTGFKKYYTIELFQLKSAKKIADIFSLNIGTISEYYIIYRAEKEGWLNLQGSTGRPKKMTQRVERKIIKSVYDSPQSSTRGLALQVEKDLGFPMKPSEMFLKNINILAGKNPCCQHKM